MYEEGSELDPATLTVTADPGTGTGTGEEPGTDDPGTEDPGIAGTVFDGALDWGVKESFRAYVTGPIAGGSVAPAGGAAENPDGTYRFPGGEGPSDAEAPALDAAFDGSVRFTGHDGALDLSFSELTVAVTGAGAELVADVSSKDMDTGEVSAYHDIAVADLDIAAGDLTPDGEVLTLDAVPATLTEDGAEAFAGFYEAGEALDPVSVLLALAEDTGVPMPQDPGTEDPGTEDPGTEDPGADDHGAADQTGAFGGATGPELAETGSDTPVVPLAIGAVALTAAGAAAFHATRRHRMRTEEEEG
jgi:hypothetical protein